LPPAGYAATLNYMVLVDFGGLIGISANGTVVSNFPAGGTSTINGGYDLTVDSQGNYIIAAGRLVKVTPGGVGSLIYSNNSSYFWSVAIDASGNYIVADVGNNRIARISPGGVITTVAPIPVLSPATDYDVYVRVDQSGNYVMAQDSGNNNIPNLHVYRITPSGGMTSITLSGYSIPSFSAVGGLAFDATGNYVIPDPVTSQIYSITPAGVVSLLASGAPLSRPYGIVRDPSNGNYIVGNLNAGTVISVGSTGSPMNTLISGSPVTYPLAIALVSPAGPITPPTFSPCDVLHEGTTDVADVQAMINEALGDTSPANDLNGDGVVNVVDVQIDINAALGLGCLASGGETTQASLPTIAAVRNAASFRRGPVSPGEVVALSGTVLESSGAEVWFDGTPARLVYVNLTQINCVVPSEVQGKGASYMQVCYLGGTSVPFSLDVNANPGLFTADGSGSGPAAALNEDQSANSPANPAARGSTVVLFLTGDGQTSPAPVPIGGQPPSVTFYGEAPAVISGVMQLTVQIPTNVLPGDLSVSVTVGGNTSQSGVTVSVRE
jgi:uncharacterized protein (TIGR03437 family)